MKDIPILINLNSDYNRGLDARRHCHTWTNHVSFVDEPLFRDSRRNLNLELLLRIWPCVRLRKQTGRENRR